MIHHQKTVAVATHGRGFTEITEEVGVVVESSRVSTGLCVVFIQHTSASLLIQENADPSVRRDLEAFFGRLVPDGDPVFSHTMEGSDDMSAHVRTALTAVSLTIPVGEGRLLLGTWQGLYLWEHRLAPHRRSVIVHVSGL